MEDKVKAWLVAEVQNISAEVLFGNDSKLVHFSKLFYCVGAKDTSPEVTEDRPNALA